MPAAPALVEGATPVVSGSAAGPPARGKGSRGTYKCPHGVMRARCADCFPPVKCGHGAALRLCPACSPPAPPGRVRGGKKRTSCLHGRYGGNCTTCSPHLVCPHKRIRRYCLACSPRRCKHNVRRDRCGTCPPYKPHGPKTHGGGKSSPRATKAAVAAAEMLVKLHSRA